MDMQDYQKAKAIFENGVGPKARKAILVGSALLFVAASPLIISAAAHTAVAAAMLAGGYVLTRRRVLMSADHALMAISDKIADKVIDVNPAGMARANVNKFRQRIEEAEGGLEMVSAKLREMEGIHANALRSRDEALNVVRSVRTANAKDPASQRLWRQQTNKAVRMNHASVRITAKIEQIRKLYRLMVLGQEGAREQLADMESEYEALELESQVDMLAVTTMREQRKLMDPMQFEIFYRSAKRLQQRSAQALGEFDTFVLKSQEGIVRMDSKQMVVDAEVLQMLAKIESGQAQTTLLKDGDVARISAAANRSLLDLDGAPGGVPAVGATTGTKRFPLLEIGAPADIASSPNKKS